MIKNIKNIISSLFHSKKQETNDFFLDDENLISIEITWDDILNSIPYSDTNSCINYAFKRNGYSVLCRNHFVELSDGTNLYPEKISDHWRCFVSSPKTKPKVIKYFKT
jgi:hypothetical protein